MCIRDSIYAARGLPVSSRPPYAAGPGGTTLHCVRVSSHYVVSGGNANKKAAYYAIKIAITRGYFGAPAGTRILGPLIKSQMLYQLSYRHVYTVVLTALLL